MVFLFFFVERYFLGCGVFVCGFGEDYWVWGFGLSVVGWVWGRLGVYVFWVCVGDWGYSLVRVLIRVVGW